MQYLRLSVLLLLGISRLHAADPLPGHSAHGEAFNEGPRQAAVLIPGCGKVSFPATTRSAEAQQFINQGVGQLHGFWYYEAERSFRQAAKIDPECAIAYWGCAMANVNNEKRAVSFIAEAAKHKKKASAREQAWISTLQTFYSDTKKEKKLRYMALIKDLEGIIHDHPDDLEAKAFLAWAIWKAKDAGVTMVSREAVNAVLQQVFARAPMHPAHHYAIHLWDDDKPARALPSAALCGQTSPGIAHMWHMPGHTFSKVNRNEDAAWQQEAANRVDHAYMMRARVLPDQIHNYAHNAEWLVRTLSQLGQGRKAVDLARNLVEIPRHPSWNSLEKRNGSAGYGRNRLLETLLKFELWDEVLALDGSAWLDTTQNPSFEASRLRAFGIAAFFRGDRVGVQRHLDAVLKLKPKPKVVPVAKPLAEEGKKPDTAKPASLKPPTTAPATAANKPLPSPAPPAKPPAGTPAKATAPPVAAKPAEAGKSNPDAALDNAISELQALLALLDARPAEVLPLLEKAKDVPKERLIRYQLRLGAKDKATALASQLPSDAPGQALRLDALVQLGDLEQAKRLWASVRKTASLLDPDLPFGKRMDALALQLEVDKTWRLPQAARKDSGVRPSLDTLGPLKWSPPASPEFKLSNALGEQVSLKDYAGRPVVVIFYLGGTCSHCMEQLKAFVAAAKDFSSAGINIVAIGSEPPAELPKTAATCDINAAPPFPLLADPDLATFKAWRCHDDFEGKPLHGTFLVDGKGRLRWLDVGHNPFQDAKFLLGEARRLLKFE